MSERAAFVLLVVGVLVAACGLALSPWPWLALLFAGVAFAAVALLIDTE